MKLFRIGIFLKALVAKYYPKSIPKCITIGAKEVWRHQNRSLEGSSAALGCFQRKVQENTVEDFRGQARPVAPSRARPGAVPPSGGGLP